MMHKKSISLILVILALSAAALAEELTIKSVERQVLLNGQYPIEQSLVEFKSHGNVNILKHVVAVSLDERIRFIVFSKSKDGKDPLPFTR